MLLRNKLGLTATSGKRLFWFATTTIASAILTPALAETTTFRGNTLLFPQSFNYVLPVIILLAATFCAYVVFNSFQRK